MEIGNWRLRINHILLKGVNGRRDVGMEKKVDGGVLKEDER